LTKTHKKDVWLNDLDQKTTRNACYLTYFFLTDKEIISATGNSKTFEYLGGFDVIFKKASGYELGVILIEVFT
jgi:hypothetical protein